MRLIRPTSLEDQGITLKRKELERKYAELEVEKKKMEEIKKSKETEWTELKTFNEELSNEINALTRNNNQKKAEIEEKDKLLIDQDAAIKNQRAMVEKLKKKKRFIWCG